MRYDPLERTSNDDIANAKARLAWCVDTRSRERARHLWGAARSLAAIGAAAAAAGAVGHVPAARAVGLGLLGVAATLAVTAAVTIVARNRLAALRGAGRLRADAAVLLDAHATSDPGIAALVLIAAARHGWSTSIGTDRVWQTLGGSGRPAEFRRCLQAAADTALFGAHARDIANSRFAELPVAVVEQALREALRHRAAVEALRTNWHSLAGLDQPNADEAAHLAAAARELTGIGTDAIRIVSALDHNGPVADVAALVNGARLLTT